jgi:ubiquinone/menaquinone biosynthesis C-methylase UbiE
MIVTTSRWMSFGLTAIFRCSANAAFVRGDAQALPFADATFDAVYCSAALDLVPDPSAVVTEMVRVLKAGGRIAVATTHEGRSGIAKRISAAVARLAESRMYDAARFPRLYRELGLRDIRLEIRGFHQYVDALKPS